MAYLKNIVEIILVLILIYFAYQLFFKPAEPPTVIIETITEIDTVYVTVVDTVKISAPAVIDTVYIEINGEVIKDVKASTETTLSGDFYFIKLTVEYWIKQERFDIEAEVEVQEKTVYVTNTITHTIIQPPPRLRPFVGLATFVKDSDYVVSANAGVCFFDKIDIYFGVNQKQYVGLGINYRF